METHTQPDDPYLLDSSQIANPPTSWVERLKQVGPGLILSASVVGSGELVATTTLGARAGFTTLWIILLSCTVKVAIQLEFGRYTIQSGETCMTAMNRLPGGRWGQAHWSIWIIMLLQPIKILQMGGIMGGLAMVMHIWFPGVSIGAWCWTSAVVVAGMVALGRYSFVERACLVLLGLFTLMTLASVVLLQWSEFAIQWQNIASGLRGYVPENAHLFILGTFGLTGVGGDEILHYNYWLLEKGYAAKTGPCQPDDPEWQARARGWIGIMYLDAILSMCAYTLVTAAFYLLGAAILHARGEIPEGYALIDTLSTVYTESFGSWGKSLFLCGAFVVLFSSLFAALAAWVRMYADAFGQIGWVDFGDVATRRRVMMIFSCLIPGCWAIAFLFIEQPVIMVIAGGIATSIILLLVVYAAVYFRYWRTIAALRPGTLYDSAFWISTLAIVAVAIYTIYSKL
ncbi:MAG: Nramp family divalent metal transporter [Planctomycetota bacterium]